MCGLELQLGAAGGQEGCGAAPTPGRPGAGDGRDVGIKVVKSRIHLKPDTSHMAFLRLDDDTLTTLVGYQWPENLTKLHLGTNQIKSLEGLPQSLTWLWLGTNQIISLKGLPAGLTHLYLEENQIKSLEGLPQSLTDLYLGTNQIISLEGVPTSLRMLDLDTNQIKSLAGLPPSLTTLDLGTNPIVSLDGLPVGLTHLWPRNNKIATVQLLTFAYCGALQFVSYTIHGLDQELRRAVRVPLNERPARVVIVVLSSSSIPRVGLRAAVRRLNRADLVREMAGML